MKPDPKFDAVAWKVNQDSSQAEKLARSREKELGRLAKRKHLGKAIVAAYLLGVRDGLNAERTEVEFQAQRQYIASLLGNI